MPAVADSPPSVASAASLTSVPPPREGDLAEGNRTVAIVGGGPAGMALALALKRHGIVAEVFEARDRAAVGRDARVLALSDGARQILEWLGAWPGSAATPIKTIHVSHRGGFGRSRMRADETEVDALGWVIAASDLIAALDARIGAEGIAYREHTLVGPGDTAGHALTAYAEGAVDPGAGQKRDYGQHAVLCSVSIAQAHGNVAYERFTGDGPLALLPLGDGYAVVLTCADETVDDVKALDDAGFLALLQQRFGTRHRFTAAGPRSAYRLGLRYRRDPVGERRVWLGNAAQTLHPVAGQGFNLALRDIWELAQQAGTAADPGAANVLAAYARGRAADRRGAIGFTDLLIEGFGSDFAPLRHARGAGLLALDLLPPLRGFVAKRMIYGARAWP